jgi:hypothetical protein
MSEIDPTREYIVAGTDWELESYGRHTLAEWNLGTRSDFPIIVREAVEQHLRG